MKLLAETFQRQFVVKECRKWIYNNIAAFVPPFSPVKEIQNCDFGVTLKDVVPDNIIVELNSTEKILEKEPFVREEPVEEQCEASLEVPVEQEELVEEPLEEPFEESVEHEELVEEPLEESEELVEQEETEELKKETKKESNQKKKKRKNKNNK